MSVIGRHSPRPPDLGRWSTPGFLQRKFKKPVVEFDKFDVTFSTSADLPGDTNFEKRNGIYNFLRVVEAIDKDEQVYDVIKRMRIGPNKFNRQVVMECVSAEKAKKVYSALMFLSASPNQPHGYSITHLDANYFKEDQIPVFISHVRSSIDVEKYLIDGFLINYGEVLSHKPMKDNKGVETFEHLFMMWEKDLRANPPPNFFWLGRNKLKVRFKGQVETCWICDAEGHKAFQCPHKLKRNAPATEFPCTVCGQPGHKAAECQEYRRKHLEQYMRDFPNMMSQIQSSPLAQYCRANPVTSSGSQLPSNSSEIPTSGLPIQDVPITAEPSQSGMVDDVVMDISRAIIGEVVESVVGKESADTNVNGKESADTNVNISDEDGAGRVTMEENDQHDDAGKVNANSGDNGVEEVVLMEQEGGHDGVVRVIMEEEEEDHGPSSKRLRMNGLGHDGDEFVGLGTDKNDCSIVDLSVSLESEDFGSASSGLNMVPPDVHDDGKPPVEPPDGSGCDSDSDVE